MPLNPDLILEADPDINYFSLNRDDHQSGYHTINKYNSINFESGSLSVLCLNIRSFFKNVNELIALLGSLSEKPDVVILNETWLCEKDLDVANIEGYTSSHCLRRTGRGGGVSIFCRKNLSHSKCDEISYCDLTLECCTIKLSMEETIYLIGIYRPHSGSKNDFTSALEMILQNNCLRNSKICLMGDFNLNTLDQSSPEVHNFENMLNSFHFFNTIREPTRIVQNCAPSLLDQCWVNFFNFSVAGILEYDLTDHCPIFINISKVHKSNPHTKFQFRLHDERKIDEFLCKLAEVRWEFTRTGNVNESVEHFDRVITQLYRETFPVKTKIYSGKNLRKPWITSAIKKSIKTKSWYFKLYNAGLVTLEFRNTYRNTLNKTIDLARDNYFKLKFFQTRNDPAKSWKAINYALNRDKSKSYIDKVNVNNRIISDEYEIANCFNNFFSNIGHDLSSRIPDTGQNLNEYLRSPILNSFFLQ